MGNVNNQAKETIDMKHDCEKWAVLLKYIHFCISGNTAKYCDSDGNPIQSLQDAALEILESLEGD